MDKELEGACELTLWRVPLYILPGFPRPTKSHGFWAPSSAAADEEVAAAALQAGAGMLEGSARTKDTRENPRRAHAADAEPTTPERSADEESRTPERIRIAAGDFIPRGSELNNHGSSLTARGYGGVGRLPACLGWLGRHFFFISAVGPTFRLHCLLSADGTRSTRLLEAFCYYHDGINVSKKILITTYLEIHSQQRCKERTVF